MISYSILSNNWPNSRTFYPPTSDVPIQSISESIWRSAVYTWQIEIAHWIQWWYCILTPYAMDKMHFFSVNHNCRNHICLIILGLDTCDLCGRHFWSIIRILGILDGFGSRNSDNLQLSMMYLKFLKLLGCSRMVLVFYVF